MKTHLSLIIICSFLLGIQMTDAKEVISSPDGKQAFVFEPNGAPFTYSVSYQNKTVVEASQLGLDLDNRVWEMALGKRNIVRGKHWIDNLVLDSVVRSTVDETWQNRYGERSTVRNNYNAATLFFSKKDESKYRMNIDVRAYNQGIAFRYHFPEHPQAIFHKVVADLTEYTFAEGTMAWAAEWAQAKYTRMLVDSVSRPSERAMTLELPNGLWAAITDADVDDWCLTKLQASAEKPHTLASVMYTPVDAVTYFSSPWHVLMVAESATQLIDNNDIVNNLNPPCAIDADWVQPGKIMRETTLTTQGAINCIDFCAAHNMQYVLFDWLWYGPCLTHDGDATQVIDKIDMPKVVAYGKQKGVGIWLYVNQHAIAKQAPELFPLLHEWGIVGIKFGFVQYASHRWAVWMHDMVRLAAENHLMVNIHDEFRPSGFSRTYPNLLTQEGICGNEEFPDATHNTVLPFTRMINGAADYTICYFDKRLQTRSHVTFAHQLAASLIFFSPLQTLFWYDKPAAYQNEPEIIWFEQLPTVFDESHTLSGTPGKSVTVARRSGNTWFVSAITNTEACTIQISTDFLEKGKKYQAEIYSDNDKVQTRTHIDIEQRKIKGGDILKFNLKPSGGIAIIITEQTK